MDLPRTDINKKAMLILRTKPLNLVHYLDVKNIPVIAIEIVANVLLRSYRGMQIKKQLFFVMSTILMYVLP